MAFCLGLAMVLGPRCVTYLRSPPESDGLVMACLLLESDGLAMATLRETSGPVSILGEKSKAQFRQGYYNVGEELSEPFAVLHK